MTTGVRMVAVFSGGLVVGAAVVVGVITKGGGDQDRPPIIVRSGSIYIDDGDKDNQNPPWQPWQMMSPPSFKLHLWKPDHPRGWSVSALEIKVANAETGSACPTAPTTADSIDLSFSESQVLNLSLMKTGKGRNGQDRFEPIVTTTLDFVDTPATSVPDALSFSEGKLTGFTAHYQNRQVAQCTFATLPGGSKPVERLRIRPVK